ncbi:MAG: hypothetical protein K9K66_10315 [Desulfarculaceae bacterium]|nr:hypothetical protein [Desulfarculaceae bacterium]MCF8073802.1 hypothetical protein [Desulfarculaceae bacterium]MCF8102043.1 hypothetical protein [Desulfarculaceae bacterium]MCF8116013.1 hypothetical protein [Desulfarculaceae bacterium]
MSPEDARPLPWEALTGPAWGLPATVWAVARHPWLSFNAAPRGSLVKAVAFAVLCTLIPGGIALALGISPAGMTPWLVLLGFMPLNALIIHVMFMTLGAAPKNPAPTFRVACYAQAPALFSFVPYVGLAAFAVWNLVILVYGLAAAYKTPLRLSLVANLIPVVFSLALSLAGAGRLFS